jgi:tRNA U54 and U55 pseudouridine synthase Pus10
MKNLKACKKKVEIWNSLPDLHKKNWSEQQWKQIIAHTQKCKVCRREIEKIEKWADENITSDAVCDIYFNEVIPNLLGIKSPKKVDERMVEKALVLSACQLFNNEKDSQTARLKMHEYFHQKHFELRIPLQKI